MILAYQAVPIQEEMNGVMDPISVILLVLMDTLMFGMSLALIVVNLSSFDLKMRSFTAMVQIMVPIAPTPLDVLLFGTSSILTGHACQVVLTHT
jgi:hypothetical protein